MRFVVVPLAGYVLLYAPGHALLRRAHSGTGEASRLLREVLLSACCTSWIGFLLAELGWFSLPLLLALLAGLAVMADLLQRRVPRPGYGRRDAIGLAVCLFACAGCRRRWIPVCLEATRPGTWPAAYSWRATGRW